ncbi:MAG: hypothetical protein V3S25_06165, partial [Nitrospirales bacterium]
IRCCDKPACGVRGMQAGGLAARSVGQRTARVRLPPSRLHAGDPLLLLVQWVDRDATGGVPIALLLQWVERNEPS